MLDKLDSIDWKIIKSGFRSSERIPQLIRDLGSTDHTVRHVAIQTLEDHIYCQGDVYEATPLVVSFLVELLADEHTQAKDEIIWVLENFTEPLEGSSDPSRPDDMFYQPAFEMTIAALDIFLNLMSHADVLVRRAALNMVWRPIYPVERLPEIKQALVDFITHERDLESRASGLLIFRRFIHWQREHLQDHIEEYANLLEGIWQSGTEEPVPQAAAIALTYVAQDQAPLLVDSYLAELAAHRQLGGRASYVEAVHAIWQLGRERGLRTLIQALNTSPNDGRAREIAECLLAGIFEDNPMRGPVPRLTQDRQGQPFYEYQVSSEQRSPADLTEVQKLAVKAVIENDRVWVVPHNMLAAFGLPADRDTVR